MILKQPGTCIRSEHQKQKVSKSLLNRFLLLQDHHNHITKEKEKKSWGTKDSQSEERKLIKKIRENRGRGFRRLKDLRGESSILPVLVKRN